MTNLTSIAPTEKIRVMDLVEQAGMDISDWSNFAGGSDKAASNPKYCYEWSFVDHDQGLIILNLWHQKMVEHEGNIVTHLNLRVAAEKPGMGVKKKRAYNMDFAIQKAIREELLVRVIVLDGDIGQQRSTTDNRLLDPEPWAVTAYDSDTGDCTLTRGAPVEQYLDQFDINTQENGPAQKVTVSGQVYVRSPEVRKRVLSRSGGQCEWCNELGFKTPDGRRYLETHHVIPLSEGGADTESNVAALCPNHHREAHFGEVSSSMRKGLLEMITSKL